MTREQFEAIMDAERWSPAKRAGWGSYTPSISPEEFKAELSRPDGMVRVTMDKVQNTDLRSWIADMKASFSLLRTES